MWYLFASTGHKKALDNYYKNECRYGRDLHETYIGFVFSRQSHFSGYESDDYLMFDSTKAIGSNHPISNIKEIIK